MSKADKIINTIALKQGIIEEIESIKEQVRKSENKKIRIKIETKHWYGFSEPFLGKLHHKICVSKETITKILNQVQDLEKERINKLIDMEIENRIKGDTNE